MKAITVTLNPSFDTTLFLDELHLDKANRVKNEITQAGGKGINVTRVLENLGVPVKAFCIIGSDDKDKFEEALGNSRNFVFIENTGKTRENITVRAGEQCIKINRSGIPVGEEIADRLQKAILNEAQRDDIIIVSGSAPKDFGSDRLLRFCAGLKKSGARLIIDSEQLSFEQLKSLSPFLIKPNEYEIRQIFGISGDQEADLEGLIDNLSGVGFENIIVSLGENGMKACLCGKKYSVKAAKIKAASTVGAGDSAVAGFAAAVILGLDDVKALKLSAGCGTAAASKEGTGLADEKTAREYAEKTEVTKKE